MPVAWDDATDAIFAGDLTAALGYRTPAGGVVVQAVAPIALRDRAAGTVGFTTSLGFSKKLERIARDPRVAMAFHAREHGRSASESYVLVQGRARVVESPSPKERMQVGTLAAAALGPARRGWFWDRWLREYYEVRVPVHVEVDRIVTWPDLRCAGAPRVGGEQLPAGDPDPQAPPGNGTGPRLDVARTLRRVLGNEHTLARLCRRRRPPDDRARPGRRRGPGRAPARRRRAAPARRAARGSARHTATVAQLIGLETRQFTGWLDVGEAGDAVYAPHTEAGYKAPPNKTLLLLLNGMLAKRGVRAARKAGRPTSA